MEPKQKNKKSCAHDRRIDYYPKHTTRKNIEELRGGDMSLSSVVDALVKEALAARKSTGR